MGSPVLVLCFDVHFTSDALGVKESSLQAGKWISSCSQGFRYPSVGCLVGVADWLDRRGRLQKQKQKLFFFFADEGVTHSQTAGIFDGMR